MQLYLEIGHSHVANPHHFLMTSSLGRSAV
jgi:hypothetical protein